jgi:predicted nucleic acid-binding protein
MGPATLFNGNKVVFDAMVIINFHGLVMLDKLIGWSPQEIVVEKRIKKEASHSMNGPIDLEPYISSGAVLEEEIHGKEQENLFYKYCNQKIGNSTIHAGEAACLALAISKGYGLASDELVIRNEFKSRCPDKTCVHSWDIVIILQKLGYIDQSEANALEKGLHYV